MATSSESVTVIDRCLMTPPPGLVSTMSLRLTLFDMIWLYAPPVQRLLIYEIPGITKIKFVDEIIPKLKDSLTAALKHYLPLVGNLIIPRNPDSGSPEILYKQGNKIPMVFAESNGIDFKFLLADHAKDTSIFYPLIPAELVQSTDESSGSIVSSVAAFQVTFFPNIGISIGITSHQAAGDANTIYRFMRIWASYSKIGEKETKISLNRLHAGKLEPPFYYRSVIKDPKPLFSVVWDQWNDILKLDRGSGISSNTSKVRQSFLITEETVKKLKELVSTQVRTDIYMTSFKVVLAYVWTCLVKSGGEEVADGEELQNFVCFGNCRQRLHHVVADNYFGNCLTVCFAKGKNGELVGEEGIPRAVRLIGAAMNDQLHNKDAPFRGAEKWLVELQNLDLAKTVKVAGAIRFNFYKVDFGWGNPIKFEFVSIDKTGSISLCGGRENDRDVEIGLSLPKARMDAFAAVFNKGLKDL